MTMGGNISSGSGEKERSISAGIHRIRFDSDVIDSRQSSTHKHKRDCKEGIYERNTQINCTMYTRHTCNKIEISCR